MTDTKNTVPHKDTVPHKLPVRTLVAASIGNAIEWYDWTSRCGRRRTSR